MLAGGAVKYEPLELAEDDGPTHASGASRFTSPSSSSASGFNQRKSVLIGAIAAVAFYTLLSLLSGSTHYDREHIIQSQIVYSSLAKDHYKKPGTLQLDRNNYRPAWRRARWIPLEHIPELTSTGRNGLERDYHLGDGFDLLEAIHAYLKHAPKADPFQDGQESPSIPSHFDYLRNKTIIVLGDGVDRNSLDYACEHLLGGQRSIRKYTEQPIDLSKESDKERRDPHLCKLPDFLQGTTIWSFMTYSILATEDTFAVPLDEVKPRRYLPRLEQIAEALKKESIEPDMVIVHST